MLKKTFLICIAFSFLLAACERTEETIELEFLGLIDDSDTGVLLVTSPFAAVFVSHEKQAYYEQKLSAYEYNNWSLSKGEKVEYIYVEIVDDYLFYSNKEDSANRENNLEMYELRNYKEVK